LTGTTGQQAPSPTSLAALARALEDCERCPLCELGTATVPGEGSAAARLFIVGEQPGNQEDITGRPFVGPAGSMLADALIDAGIERDAIYLTNAVKRFKFVLRGKRRIHQKPNVNEIEQCRWWLDLERTLVTPRATVALGATAARSLLGRPVRIGDVRGKPMEDEAGNTIVVTVHPSYLLRLRDRRDRARERENFAQDLRTAHAISVSS
jgi:DNA polymerase